MAEMVNREVGEDADGVDREEPPHTATLETQGEQEPSQESSPLEQLGAVCAMPAEGAGDPEALNMQAGLYYTDESIPPIQRLERYLKMPKEHRDRNLIGRLFLETLKTVADDPHDVASVVWMLYDMSQSEDPSIRSELMDHLPHIAMLCHSEREKIIYVVEHLLQMVAKQLTDPVEVVRKAAQVTLLVLMDQSLVGPTAVEEFVCPSVIHLSNPNQFPDSAVQLMSKMAPFLGREATERLFLARFCNLCRDKDVNIRKMCAAYFGEFCAVVGPSTTEDILLGRFVDLCTDENAAVRKACAEVIMSVSCACTLHRRKTVLAPIFITLLWDAARWVRSSAFKTLGPFISTFAVPSVADLVYNENGELVLVNREGCEFRLDRNADKGNADDDDDGLDAQDFEEPKEDKGSTVWQKGPRSWLVEHGINRPRSPVKIREHRVRKFRFSSRAYQKEKESFKRFQDELVSASPGNQNTDTKTSDSDAVFSVDDESKQTVEESESCQAHEAAESRNTSNQGGDTNSPSSELENLSEGTLNTSQDEDSEVDSIDSDIVFNGDESLKGTEEEGPVNVSKLGQEYIASTLDSDGNDTTCSGSVTTCDVLEKQATQTNSSDDAKGWSNSPGPLAKSFPQLSAKRSLESSSESSSDCATLETDIDDFSHSQGESTSDNSLGKNLSSSSSTPASTPSEEWDFNSFQYWRTPIPELTMDYEFYKVFDNVMLGELIRAESAENAQIEESANDSMNDRKEHESDSALSARQDIVPQELVELFASMASASLAHMTDIEISLHCAFSLPAVALTLGRENWCYLRRTYRSLAENYQWKVRRTVACSIHEMAEILGEEIALEDLVPIYTGLIKDLDEVRIGALKHLAHFVKLLPAGGRKSFLNQFEMFLVTDNDWNWRFREELAQQLLRIIPLYTPEETYNHLVPIAIALLSDKVSAVRASALVLVAGLINHVTTVGFLFRKLLPKLAQEFAHSTRWERRQAFALLCSHLVSGRVLGGDQFAREVLPYLLDLSYDRVPNVRLAVAKTLASDIMAHQFFSSAQSPHQEVLMQVLKRLINDKDRDVRFFADPHRGHSSQILQQVPCNVSPIQQMPSC